MKYRLFRDSKKEIKENLKDLKVIYTDLDGTLFNDRGCIIKDEKGGYYFEAVELLPEIARKNWDVVLVSGRNKFQLGYNAQIIGLKNYIAELGSELVYNLGKEVYATFDRQKIKYDLTYEGKDLIKIIELFKKNFPDKIESKMEWSRHRSHTVLFFGEINLNFANKLLKKEGYGELVMVDNGLSSLVELGLDIERLHIYNLMPEGVNKANGIKLDKKIRNFDINNCIALGDSLEDLKMAGEVKYFFLMGNALEHKEMILDELDKYNNVYVTGGVMNKGWAEVIEYLVN
ncbi:MAG: HAD family phosphatase [Actinobacteria bacterium]|nr:HAD family phosphatase [Actinomycetota bacterium]